MEQGRSPPVVRWMEVLGGTSDGKGAFFIGPITCVTCLYGEKVVMKREEVRACEEGVHITAGDGRNLPYAQQKVAADSDARARMLLVTTHQKTIFSMFMVSKA